MNKRLTKSKSNIVISGSLAGVADFFGIDPTIVRVIYVILSVATTGFPGFLLYIALMVLLPSGNTQNKNQDQSYDEHYSNYHPYKGSTYNSKKTSKPRKEVEKVDVSDDDWSDF